MWQDKLDVVDDNKSAAYMGIFCFSFERMNEICLNV